MKHIQVASKSKRILSGLIDLSIISILFCLSYFFIFYKAVSAVQNFDKQNNIITEERLKSGLYIKKGDKVISILENNPDIDHKELEISVKNYYTDYLYNKSDKTKIDYTPYWYAVTILHLPDTYNKIEGEKEYKEEEILYKWKEGYTVDNPIYEEKGGSSFSTKDYKEFNKNNFGTAIYNLSLSDLTPVKKAARTISFGTVRALMYSSMLSTFIPCFIIPISLKNGKTIGKLVTKLIVLTDEGYEYKRYKHIFRYLSFYIIEVFGGVITIGITFILSTSLVLFSKKRRALHDYISFSVVADEPHTVFYKDINEENNYISKNANILTIY